MSTILVTGATGFVGRGLCSRLLLEGRPVLSAVRKPSSKNNSVMVGDIGPDTRWEESLKGVETVIHLAARVHVMKERASDPLGEFRRVNVAGTLNLAREAAKAGVKRLIFLSTVKVNGEATYPYTLSEGTGMPYSFTEQDDPHPQDPYSISKYEAEMGLRLLAQETGLEVVIIRPPLVYGPGVKGNFQRMMLWIDKGIPLPLGAIHNQRSLVALDNLVDFIITCIDHPAAANQTFLVADDDDVSTTDLLRRVGMAMNKKTRLIPVSTRFLELSAGLLGKQNVIKRLCGNLQLDISKAKEMIDWTPSVTLDDGIKRAVREIIGTTRNEHT